MRRLLLVAGAAVLAASACAGPHAPLEVGVQDFASNVQFGGPSDLTPPPLPPVAMILPAPLAVPLPPLGPSTPAPTTTTPTAPRLACPPASPFAVTALSSVNSIAKPPVPGTYRYRDTGTYQTSGASPTKGAYPTTQTRTVGDVARNAVGGFTFSVAATLGDTVTTTTYSYTPPTYLSESELGAVPLAGLYITGVTTHVGTQPPTTFNPLAPGLLLLEAPANPGDIWTSVGIDPSSATIMAFTATQMPDVTVDACGQVLDAIHVHLDGNIELSENVAGVAPMTIPTGINLGARAIGLDTNTTFTADYDIVDQYGGLSVQDDVDTTGTDQGVGINRQLASTIDEVPKTP